MSKGGFQRVYAAPDDPTSIDEASSLSLVIMGPSAFHSGKGAAKSLATDAVADALTRCRAAQRRFRNTLLFSVADEGLLGTAREAMRRSLAWSSIVADKRLQEQMTQIQAIDAREKAKTASDGAQKAVRLAWSHVLFPEKDADTAAGAAFHLQHLSITSKDRTAIPGVLYEKARGDGIIKERLGPDSLALQLKPLWAVEKPHLPISEIADWFASYVYLPKLRDRVVLDAAIRDAVAKLDPSFGYADAYDDASKKYAGLAWGKSPPETFPSTAVLVRAEAVLQQLRDAKPSAPAHPDGGPKPVTGEDGVPGGEAGDGTKGPAPSSKPKRFFGSVEIDMVRPVKAFDAILNAVVMELQRTKGAKVKLTLEIEAEAAAGFADDEVGIVRDNAKQLKFNAGSTGFED